MPRLEVPNVRSVSADHLQATDATLFRPGRWSPAAVVAQPDSSKIKLGLCHHDGTCFVFVLLV